MSTEASFSDNYSAANSALIKRITRTTDFLQRHTTPGRVLDLGVPNMLGERMTAAGYEVVNTEHGLDLDLDFEVVRQTDFDIVTAFEIFEHMVAPFNLLRAVKAPALVASIPMSLWFAKAYWNEKDPWDRHYHEFEDRQFDMLLNKAGWVVKHSEKWTSYTPGSIGIRPLLRRFTPRYYIVHCERM